MNYWLVKSEPAKYSWDTFEKEGRTFWDGVRNFQARNNLRAMKAGDLALYYHSNEGKAVVGIARVVTEAYPDPTTDDPNWVVVDLVPEQRLTRPVSLQQIKKDERLQNIGLLRQTQLSVMPLRPEEFDLIVGMGESGGN
jgi:predicted RNA-binding protein with PUA-like domain